MEISSGIDIIEIDSFIKLISRREERFLKRAFSTDEITYCRGKPNRYQHFAARLAVKEATMKALGCGWDKGIQWNHIEVKNNGDGAPYLQLQKQALDLFSNLEFTRTTVSISHCKRYVTAMVIMYKN